MSKFQCRCSCHQTIYEEAWSFWCVDCGPQHEADLTEVARCELYRLWGDMDYARATAIRTDWTIRMENVAARIVALSRLVGTLPWPNIPVPTLRSGVYQRVYDQAALTYPAID